MKNGLQKQIDAGVLRECGCGCGEITPKPNAKYVNGEHYQRAYRQRNRKPRKGRSVLQQQNWNKLQAVREEGAVATRVRLLDNARRLYRWARDKDWFFKRDVKIADTVETEWLWASIDMRWKRMMRFMLKQDFLEVRKVRLYTTHGMMIKQYRIKGEYDEEFANG